MLLTGGPSVNLDSANWTNICLNRPWARKVEHTGRHLGKKRRLARQVRGNICPASREKEVLGTTSKRKQLTGRRTQNPGSEDGGCRLGATTRSHGPDGAGDARRLWTCQRQKRMAPKSLQKPLIFRTVPCGKIPTPRLVQEAASGPKRGRDGKSSKTQKTQKGSERFPSVTT